MWPPRAPAHVLYMYAGETLKHIKREEENENPDVVVSVNTAFRRQRQEELCVIMSLKPVWATLKKKKQYIKPPNYCILSFSFTLVQTVP